MRWSRDPVALSALWLQTNFPYITSVLNSAIFQLLFEMEFSRNHIGILVFTPHGVFECVRVWKPMYLALMSNASQWAFLSIDNRATRFAENGCWLFSNMESLFNACSSENSSNFTKITYETPRLLIHDYLRMYGLCSVGQKRLVMEIFLLCVSVQTQTRQHSNIDIFLDRIIKMNSK